MTTRKRIAILGGGIGALTTAWGLTQQPGWQDEYEITIYQMGWRLGGKCASSRAPDQGWRIEEHGLHVWFGFYDNAFAMMRACYAELDRPAGSPLARFDQAFTPQNNIWMLEQHDGHWSRWQVPFPQRAGTPGTPSQPTGLWALLQDLLKQAHEALDSWTPSSGHRPFATPDLPDWARDLNPKLATTPAASALHAAFAIMQGLGDDLHHHQPTHHALITTLLRRFRQEMETRLLALIRQNTTLRRLWITLDLALTVVIGALVDRLPTRGLQAIDDQDFRAWLSAHGANPAAVASTPLRALYDCCFAYRDGDLEQPDFAAGTALGCALRIGLLYRGSVLYLMNSGMGDVVITPLYQALRARGVRFAFFQKVKHLVLSDDGRRIARVRFGRQATVNGGDYQPLLDSPALGQPVWPPTPLYAQLREGDELRRRRINLESHWSDWRDVEEWDLELADGDQVVLGISLGGLAPLCPELAAADPRWQQMLTELPSMQTQAVQLWFDADLGQLGWPGTAPAMVAAPEPLDVWADMSQVLRDEAWPQGDAPRSVQYFCGPLAGNMLQYPASDPAVPDRALEDVRRQTIRWFESHTGPIWPDAVAPPHSAALDWRWLHAPAAMQGRDRLDAQWLKANIDPSERYVLSPAGANLLRLAPDDSGFENLVLSGDWTRTAINAGCVEAAVMSGLTASRALCGHPHSIHGEHLMRG